MWTANHTQELTRDILPIFLRKNLRGRLQLASANIHRRARLAFLLLLSDAKHDLQSLLERLLRLLGNEHAVLARHAEALPALGMAQDHPRHAQILELTRANLACVRAGSGEAAVLRGDGNILPHVFEAEGKVNEGGADDDFGVGGELAGSVEVGDDLLGRFDSAVVLPMIIT